MGVLATFDSHADWTETHVCDSLVLDNLAPLGAAWGRWNVRAPWPVKGPLARLLEDRRGELTQLHERFGTASVERVRLRPADAERADGPSCQREWQRPRTTDAATVHWVLQGTLLIYLQTDAGHVGVLCEAGEWLAIPAGLRFARHAGAAPDLDLLVLSAAAAEPGSAASVDVRAWGVSGADLPSLDAFVETMLELTGHAADD